jgi:hypothetical protein
MIDEYKLNPNQIPSSNKANVSEQFEKVKGIFDNQFMPKEDSLKKAKTNSKQRTNVQGFLESKDIKNNDWEQVKPASKITDSPFDVRAVKPSAAGIEDYYGGTGVLPGSGNSIFDPNAMKRKRDNKLTQIVLKDADNKRKEKEERLKGSLEAREEWEVVSKAKSTNDIYAGKMGFTPHRTPYEQQPIKDIKFTNTINKKNEESGKRAAELKRALDRSKEKEMDAKYGEGWTWEKEALGNIYDSMNKTEEQKELKNIFAPDYVPFTENKIKPLEGIFSMPEDPASYKEKNLKRDSSALKDERKTRKEDRSWEKVTKPSKY